MNKTLGVPTGSTQKLEMALLLVNLNWNLECFWNEKVHRGT